MPNDADRAGTPAGVFGAELRFYRTRAGLSQKDLAARATVSHDVISKIETGGGPRRGLPAPPRRGTRAGHERRPDPPVGSPEEGPEAAPVRLVPGVGRHRSPGHGPALVRAARRPRPAPDRGLRPRHPQRETHGNLDDLDDQVAARLARQAILDRTGAPQLWCVLDEGVLHRAIGGSKVMRSQLYHLAEVAEHPRTTIQVIRTGGAHAGLLAHSSSRTSTASRPWSTWRRRRTGRSPTAPQR